MGNGKKTYKEVITTGDYENQGIINGSTQELQYQWVDSTAGYVYMKCGEVQSSNNHGTDIRGYLMLYSGSIVSKSICYDQTIAGSHSLIVWVNNSAVWSTALTDNVATGVTEEFTQARGADTFSAGDIIYIAHSDDAGSGNTVDQMFAKVEIIID